MQLTLTADIIFYLCKKTKKTSGAKTFART